MQQVLREKRVLLELPVVELVQVVQRELLQLARMKDIWIYRHAESLANAGGRTPVVFIHGLWLLGSSWDRWSEYFEAAGFAALSPGWPDDPDTVDQANAHPEIMANKTVGQVADHFEEAFRTLRKLPPVKAQGYFSTWPAVVHTAREIAFMEPEPMRVWPSSAASSWRFSNSNHALTARMIGP